MLRRGPEIQNGSRIYGGRKIKWQINKFIKYKRRNSEPERRHIATRLDLPPVSSIQGVVSQREHCCGALYVCSCKVHPPDLSQDPLQVRAFIVEFKGSLIPTLLVFCIICVGIEELDR